MVESGVVGHPIKYEHDLPGPVLGPHRIFVFLLVHVVHVFIGLVGGLFARFLRLGLFQLGPFNERNLGHE